MAEKNKHFSLNCWHIIQSGNNVRINKLDEHGVIVQEVRLPKSVLKALVRKYYEDL